MARNLVTYPMIFGTLLIAMVLMIIPVPESLVWFRPYWLAMFIIYWSIESPTMMNMGLVFVSGIVLDILTGALLGQHALGLVIITYIVHRFRLRLRFFRLWQQAIVVMIMLANDRLIYTWIHALVYGYAPGWQIMIAPLVAMVMWPWAILAMDLIRRQIKSTQS